MTRRSAWAPRVSAAAHQTIETICSWETTGELHISLLPHSLRHRLAILGPNKVTDASRRTWYLGGSESLFEQGESDVFVPIRPFPPLYVWPSRLASSSRLASKLSRLAHQQSSPGSHKPTELNRLETYMRHLTPVPPAATNAPVPLTQLVGDLRIGRCRAPATDGSHLTVVLLKVRPETL